MLARGTSTTRTLRLERQANPVNNGRLLASFEDVNGVVLPIYESLNDGVSWSSTPVATVADGVHPSGTPSFGWALQYQPDLYELPQAVGNLAQGTLLLAGNAIRRDANGTVVEQQLQLYTSVNLGRTWTYRSTIVTGTGAPEDVFNNSAVWEPNIQVAAGGQLVVYYSSEQHKAEGYNQLLAHKVSSDGGFTWSSEVRDVAVGPGFERPGMPVVEKLPDGRYVMSYEDVLGPNSGQVHLKFSNDGLNWGTVSDRGTGVRTAAGSYPAYMPYVAWIPVGGPKGLLVVSSRDVVAGTSGERKLYYNDNLGLGPWWEMTAPVQYQGGNDLAGWSQSLLRTANGAGVLHLSSSATGSDIAQNQVRFATSRLYPHRYQAENAALTNARVSAEGSASNGAKAGYIDFADSSVSFPVYVEAAGTFPVTVRYANNWGASSHQVSVNGGAPVTVSYANTGLNVWASTTVNLPLSAGSNTITFRKGANYAELDYIELPTRINDSVIGTGREQFEFGGAWAVGGFCGECYGGNDHYSNVPGAAATLRFNGTRVRLSGIRAPNTGVAAISVDGGPETTVDLYAASRRGQQVIYASPVLTVGEHTVRVRVTGTKNPSASDTFVTLDSADITP